MKEDAPILRKPLADARRAVERMAVVRSYSPVSETSPEESDIDGDEAFARILHKAELRAAVVEKDKWISLFERTKQWLGDCL